MNKNKPITKKEIIVYLYEIYGKNNAKVFDELMRKKDKMSFINEPIKVRAYFKEHAIKMKDYITLADKGWLNKIETLKVSSEGEMFTNVCIEKHKKTH